MAQLFKRAAARRDLIAHYVYLADTAGLPVADAFLVQAEASFALILVNPSIGSPVVLRHPALQGLRKWRVSDFESFLIFYLPHERGASVIRVLHATQDWWRLLGVATPD